MCRRRECKDKVRDRDEVKCLERRGNSEGLIEEEEEEEKLSGWQWSKNEWRAWRWDEQDESKSEPEVAAKSDEKLPDDWMWRVSEGAEEERGGRFSVTQLRMLCLQKTGMECCHKTPLQRSMCAHAPGLSYLCVSSTWAKCACWKTMSRRARVWEARTFNSLCLRGSYGKNREQRSQVMYSLCNITPAPPTSGGSQAVICDRCLVIIDIAHIIRFSSRTALKYCEFSHEPSLFQTFMWSKQQCGRLSWDSPE